MTLTITKPQDAFRPYFDVLVNHEGGLSMVPSDPGNWTSGRVGVGVLRGTKYGISAAAYPKLHIAGLSLQDAFDIYFEDYWQRCACDEMPGLLAYMVFDAAVNCGAGNASRFLQRALNVADDGWIGEITRAALSKTDPLVVAEGLARERATHHTKLRTWSDFGKGWAIRLAMIPVQAMRLAARRSQGQQG